MRILPYGTCSARWAAAALVLALSSPWGFVSAGARQATTTISLGIWNPCAGELVGLSGELHTVTRITTDGNRVHWVIRTNAQGLRGVSDAGRTYHATRNLEVVVNGDGLQAESTALQSFNLVSEGSGENFLVHLTSHVTVNANGETTVEVVQAHGECRD